MSHFNLVNDLVCHESPTAQWLEHLTNVEKDMSLTLVSEKYFFFVQCSWQTDTSYWVQISLVVHSISPVRGMSEMAYGWTLFRRYAGTTERFLIHGSPCWVGWCRENVSVGDPKSYYGYLPWMFYNPWNFSDWEVMGSNLIQARIFFRLFFATA